MLLVFFEQKAAYDMRISDWSSDVCSSDLEERQRQDDARAAAGSAACADGRADDGRWQDARRLFHPISGGGTGRGRDPDGTYDPPDEGRETRRGARATGPLRLFGSQGDDRGEQDFRRRELGRANVRTT